MKNFFTVLFISMITLSFAHADNVSNKENKVRDDVTINHGTFTKESGIDKVHLKKEKVNSKKKDKEKVNSKKKESKSKKKSKK